MFGFKKKKKENLFEIKIEISSGIPFRWEYEIEDNNICEFVKTKVKGEKTKRPICGGSVETTYYFKGLKEGTTKIIFKYVNFADNYLSEINEYQISVDNELNIKLISKENKRIA